MAVSSHFRRFDGYFFFIIWHVICSEKTDRQNYTDIHKLSSGMWQHSKMMPVITLWATEVCGVFFLHMCVWAEYRYASVTNAQLAGLPPGLTGM